MDVHEALPAMQGLASRIWSRASRQHPGQLSWSVFYGEDLDLGPVETTSTGGGLTGWAWAESDTWLELCVDRAHGDATDELVAWFVARAPDAVDLHAMVLESEDHLLGPLRATGFEPTDLPWFTHHHLDLAELPPALAVPGYTFRHVEPGESEARAACHRSAWSDDGTSRVTGAAYRSLMSAPLYRTDLDWVALDDAGRMVASVCLWWDETTGVVLVEPVGCAPAHRGRGLAGAVSLAALHAARDAGATEALVCPRGDDDYPVPGRVYRGIGFRPGLRTVTLRRPGSVPRPASGR